MSLALTATLLLLWALSNAACAAPAASPEPVSDPLADERLLLIPAGPWSYRRRFAERPLSDGARICPADYPAGFSVRCAPPFQPPRDVSFFVDGVFQRREWHAPYCLAGDFPHGTVWRWQVRGGEHDITCRYGSSAADQVSVRVVVGC